MLASARRPEDGGPAGKPTGPSPTRRRHPGDPPFRDKEVPLRLHSLLRHAEPAVPPSDYPDLDVRGVQDDSRLVRPGDLFVARPGVAVDGAAFTRDAVAKGAIAVVTGRAVDGMTTPQIVVANPAGAVSRLAHAFAGGPSQFVKVLGVTGTNGKTTTAYLVRHILNAARHRCGMIGTVEVDDGLSRTEAAMTTPGAIKTAELLATMRANHCHAAAVEVSSHALEQGRVAGVRFAGAGFTNLTGDHLDYHGTMDAYADAKAKLFAGLAPDAVAAVNADSPAHERIVRDCTARVLTFGLRVGVDYRATDFCVTAHGTTFVLASPDGKTEVGTKLIGRHNLENALCAITLCCETFGLTVHQAAAALRTAAGAPGRLEPVATSRPFAVLVDYAHTDDALRNVLSALRPLTRGRLRVVFGCGGDRDRSKRPRMARVAEQLADEIYVTSDNPRTEDAGLILQEILTGFNAAARKRVAVEVDRQIAIGRAIGDAAAGDVVLIAGKGHENYQIVGTTRHPFDDAEEARRALDATAGVVR